MLNTVSIIKTGGGWRRNRALTEGGMIFSKRIISNVIQRQKSERTFISPALPAILTGRHESEDGESEWDDERRSGT